MSVKNSVLILVLFLVVRIIIFGFTHMNGPYIEVFDVGQGDAIFIMTAHGKNILIDTGPDYSVDFWLSEKFYLNNCYIDLAIITHAHLDHYGGLERIAKRCHIQTLIINDISSLDWVARLNIPNINQIYQGAHFLVDDISFCVLWPPKNPKYISDITNPNNHSIVVLMDRGVFEALFTGDAEVPVWSQFKFLSRTCPIDGDLDLLKVAHHGSSNGLYAPLLSKLKPLISVISVGIGNKYGHPSKEVISFLEKLGSKVLRTDFLGNMVISF